MAFGDVAYSEVLHVQYSDEHRRPDNPHGALYHLRHGESVFPVPHQYVPAALARKLPEVSLTQQRAARCIQRWARKPSNKRRGTAAHVIICAVRGFLKRRRWAEAGRRARQPVS